MQDKSGKPVQIYEEDLRIDSSQSPINVPTMKSTVSRTMLNTIKILELTNMNMDEMPEISTRPAIITATTIPSKKPLLKRAILSSFPVFKYPYIIPAIRESTSTTMIFSKYYHYKKLYIWTRQQVLTCPAKTISKIPFKTIVGTDVLKSSLNITAGEKYVKSIYCIPEHIR